MAKKLPTLTDRRDETYDALCAVNDALDEAKKRVAALFKLHETEFGSEKAPYVEDGSFTHEGKKRLRQLFAEGKRNRELARFFNVTDAAIAYHRNKVSTS